MEKILKEIHGSTYETVYASMTDERMNHSLLSLEKTYEDFPGRGFFDEIAGKIEKYYKDCVRSELTHKRTAIEAMERAGATGEGYERTAKETVALSKKLGNIKVDAETLLKKEE